MDLGGIVGQLMQGGLSSTTSQRVQHAAGDQGLGGLGGGLDDILGGLMGGTGNSQGGGGLGGILGSVGGMLSGDSGVGGLSRGQVGGIGAIAGALLGGGGGAISGAAKGGAMALLGTLAISALRNWQSRDSAEAAKPELSDEEVAQITAPQTAELCLRGMIEAVKSDGHVADAEIQRIVGKLQEGGITPEEQRFVSEQMAAPADPAGLIAAIPNREVGAQVYAAALMAITVDTPAERGFLANLASGAGLDTATVARLHSLVGAPTV